MLICYEVALIMEIIVLLLFKERSLKQSLF